MPSTERLYQQDNRPHWQYEAENDAECHIGFRKAACYCAEASGFLFGYSLEGIDHANNEWNRKRPSEDSPPKEKLSLSVITGAIVHFGPGD